MSENISCLLDNNCSTSAVYSTGALYRTILIIVGGTILSFLTTVGNLLVLISFRLNKQLRTVTNYFLLSLAIADFTIGLFSIPIFFAFFEKDRWPFNAFLCDVWLSVDYTMSNASVANLLLICFDRYLSITRPLTYRAKRTPRRVSMMIACAWAISCLIWTPWIWAWPFIDKRPPPGECQLPFASKATVAIPTAIAAFYLPVTLMCLLYFRIYRETVKRRKELHLLQAQHRHSSNGRTIKNVSTVCTTSGLEHDESFSLDSDRSQGRILSTQNSTNENLLLSKRKTPNKLIHALNRFCWPRYWKRRRSTRKGKEDDDCSSEIRPVISPNITDSFSLTTNGKMCFVNNHANSSEPTKVLPFTDPWIRRCDHPSPSKLLYDRHEQIIQYETRPYHRSLSSTTDDFLTHRPLINTIDKDIEYVESRLRGQTTVSLPSTHCHQTNWRRASSTRRYPHVPPPSSTNDQQPTRSLPSKQTKHVIHKSQTAESNKSTKRRLEKIKDQKAAKTLSAILIAFIVTWLPYNTNIIISTIKPNIFQRGFPMYWERFGYMLCYINSTINPMLYALCNGTFRRTFARILRCQCRRRHTPVHIQRAYRFPSKKNLMNNNF